MPEKSTLVQKMFAEGIGTFLLVFLGGGSIIISSYFLGGSTQLLAIALAQGIALSIAVTMAMGISGGHINPAVTIAMLVTKRIKASEAANYIIAQIIGAVIGAALLFSIPSYIAAGSDWGLLTMSTGVNVYQAIALEAIITFILVMAVFGTVVDKRAPHIGGFGVGLALMADILVAGPLTGAAANPARALGPEIVLLNFTNWYVYVIGPIIGGIAAALIYQKFIINKR